MFRIRLAAAPLILALGLLANPIHAPAAESLLENEAFTGDFDEMLEARTIRVLVVYNKMMYFFDEGTQRGINYEVMQEFEKFINEKYQLGTLKLHMVYLPVPRDRLLPLLVEGKGDIASANLTVTEKRRELVDFTDPGYTGVKEELVTGPSAPEIKTVDDLSGQIVHVRESSSYHESLARLNEDFQNRGLDPIELVAANELLEDGDLLEMVNAGLIPMILVDSHKAEFWADIFDKITVRGDIVLREGGEIAWAIRKNNPKLKEISNEFIKTIKKGTLMGNILLKRYLKDNKWVRNPIDAKEREKFDQMVDLLVKYADEYDFDYLMLGALGYQESRLDQNVRSSAGAIGVMQMLKSTAKDPNVGIPEIEELENNIHAGAKYLRFLRSRYFSDPAIDDLNQTLFTFAAYNAGPAKVRRLREETAKLGLDPNIWFANVEVASAKIIGRETTQYVSNIFKYFVAYKLALGKAKDKQEAVESMQDG